MNDFSTEVAKGKAALDEHFGPEWVERVDWDKLRMSSTSSCILGQLFGDDLRVDPDGWRDSRVYSAYELGLHRLGLLTNSDDCACCCVDIEGNDYGFCTEKAAEGGRTDWQGLGNAWRKAVGKELISQ